LRSQIGTDLIWCYGNGMGHKDQFVGGLGHFFLGQAQLFKQFLALTQADLLDVDVHIRFIPGQTDHLFGQIEDLDGLTHVKDEDLPAFGVHGGLKDQD
jgi:hypothetical protein